MLSSLLIGLPAGARSLTPLAAVSEAARRGALPKGTGAPEWLGSRLVELGVLAPAAGELCGISCARRRIGSHPRDDRPSDQRWHLRRGVGAASTSPSRRDAWRMERSRIRLPDVRAPPPRHKAVWSEALGACRGRADDCAGHARLSGCLRWPDKLDPSPSASPSRRSPPPLPQASRSP